MLVSVIIPNYNHEKYLERRIETVLGQTYQNIEVIILDDASTDSSKEIIEKYRSHPLITHIVYNSQNSGSPFKQWKKGIELAKGEWIWIAESDDYADLSFLEKAVETIKANPSTGIFYCDAYITFDNAEKSRSNYSQKKNAFFNTSKWSNSYCKNGIDEINESLKYVCTINNVSSTVFKKELAKPLIATLEKFIYHGDWYFYLKLCSVTNICYTNKCLNFYRTHPESHLNTTGFTIQKKKEQFYILKTLYDDINITDKQKLIHHFCAYYLSFGLLKNGLKNGYILIKAYLQIDKPLALRVIKRILLFKVLRKNYKGWFD